MLSIKKISTEGADLDTIRALFTEYQQELDENLCFQSFDAELENPLKKYGAPLGTLSMAFWNDQPAGCIALTKIEGEAVCEMKRLFVRPAFRKYGIGKELVKILLADAITMGFTEMKLDTLRKLEAAIRVYESFGFEHTTAYYENPLSNVVYMRKSLA